MESLGWALTQNNWCPYKSKVTHEDTQGEHYDMAEAEAEVMKLPASDTRSVVATRL